MDTKSELRAVDFLKMKYLGELLIPFDEACKCMGISKQTGYNWNTDGRFPVRTQKPGKSILVDIRDLGEYLDKCRTDTDYLPAVPGLFIKPQS